jgi:hypothetical protein
MLYKTFQLFRAHTVCQSSIDDFSIFGADGKTQKISDGKNNGIVPNRKKREMGKTTVSSKKLKMGDGKNDGKRKKPENCRWENRRKNEKTRKLSMGKTTENEKNQKIVDGKNDGKWKKPENSRWNFRWETKEKRGNKNKKTFAFSIGLLLETEKKSNNFSPG